MAESSNSTKSVKEFWDNQARVYGRDLRATMPDHFLKKLETESIGARLQPGQKVADIGCGNGYSTLSYATTKAIDITGIDYSELMIENAKQALAAMSPEVGGRVRFQVGNVLELEFADGQFDAATTDRCLINLTSREEQARGIREVHRILKPGGTYLMCEDTEQGLARLNLVRKHVGLDEVTVRWHNLYMDEGHVLATAEPLFELAEVANFSSFYYLASRIINGKIAQEQNREPSYDSDINRIAAMCSSLPGIGDFGPLKLFVFRTR